VGIISDEIIEDVRQRSDIVEVVTRHVSLKKTGKNYIGLCPFHSERTPSFTVTPDKQIFYCFGCNAGGDVFRFLMLKNNLTFYEAVSSLAEQAGITIPSSDSPDQLVKKRKLEGLRRINHLAKEFFQNMLWRHDSAAGAREYLSGRELPQELLERFQVGFAHPGWSNLLEFLEKKGYRPKDAAQAGLVIESQTGSYYDRFRNRIVFPIWNATGQVIGFGGRVLDESLPKYLNTPETPLFSKGRTLYGLHLARASIREKGYVIVVEGYMDVLTAHLYGITNAVASLGTALTADQGRMLMNYTRNVVIAYDADAAGVAATMRGLDLLQELGCQVRVVSIPDGKDPDDFIKRHGYQSWEYLVEQSPSLIGYKLQQSAGRGHSKSIALKLEVMQDIFPSLSLKGEVEREEGLKEIAAALNLSWETVAGEFKKFKASLGKKWTKTDNIVKNTHNIVRKEEKLDVRGKAESILLRIILEDPSLAVNIQDELGKEPFTNSYHQEIFKHFLIAAEQPGYRPENIFKFIQNDVQNVLSMLLTLDIPGENPEQIFKAYIESINRYIRQERRENLLKEIREAENTGNDKLFHDLFEELIILKGIDEAEKTGNRGRAERLLKKHREKFTLNNGKRLEGRDTM